jgi:cell division septation protein DedD
MANESPREIQLGGKQLVFVFMAATVVSVAIFLSGVMVGRTVPIGGEFDLTSAQPDDERKITAVDLPLAAASVTSGGSVAANEVITYPSYLEADAPPEETIGEMLQPIVVAIKEPPAEATDIAASARSDELGAVADETGLAPTIPEAGLVASSAAEPAGEGFVVQVAAVSRRPEAEAIAGDLSTKGYPAFVTTLGSGAPLVFRVRIGKYSDRREAELVAGRLEREEQFKPWVTR